MTPSLSSWLPRTTSRLQGYRVRNIYAEIKTKHHQTKTKDTLTTLLMLTLLTTTVLLVWTGGPA